MPIQQLFVPRADHILQSQRSNCPERGNCLCGKFRTLCKNCLVHLLELDLVADAIVATDQEDGQCNKSYHYTEFPCKNKADDEASGDVEDGCEDHGHVYTEELLKLGWIVSYTSGKCTTRVVFCIEKWYWFSQDALEILLAVRR
jgi:hypothetical protein